MTIGAEFVGMLIGRGGEVVKQLSTESGARIEISKTENEGGKAGERTVLISGLQDRNGLDGFGRIRHSRVSSRKGKVV
jgi:hypothetical protein